MTDVSYFDFLAAVRRFKVGGAGIKLTLMILAERAGYYEPDDEWSCYPGQELIATETEQSVRTVRDQLAGLESMGVITSTQRYSDGGGRTSKVYRFNLETLGLTIPADPASNPEGHTGNIGDHTGRLLPDNNQREVPENKSSLSVPTGTTNGSGFPTAAAIRLGTPYPEAFEELWRVYPRRIGKTAAYKAWLARIAEAKKAGVSVERRTWAMTTAATHYAASVADRATEHIKHPSTFLGPDEHWKDFVRSSTPPDVASRRRVAPPTPVTSDF